MAQSEKQRENIMQREYQSMAPDTVEDKNGAENKIKKTILSPFRMVFSWEISENGKLFLQRIISQK